MKKYLIFTLLWSSCFTSAQNTLPKILIGLWHTEDGKNFEKWEQYSATKMMGLGYQLVENQPKILEYLEIEKEGKKCYLSATVKGQNQGEEIEFVMKRNDSVVIFENKKHDFPQVIQYTKIGNDTLKVDLSSQEKNMSYFLIRETPLKTSLNANPNYNEALAEQLDGDQYGMKSYTFVILKTGPNENKDKDFRNACFASHMANIEKLVAEGKMVVAGPYGKNDLSFRGLFILNTSDMEEAKLWLQGDQAIVEGIFIYDLIPWYGSAALEMYLKFHDQIWVEKP